MNLLVQLLYGFIPPVIETAVSKAFILVVPTAHTRCFLFFASLIIFAACAVMKSSSESTLSLDKSSTSIGLKLPRPGCKVISAKLTPLISNCFINIFEKCIPAVGAAIAPSCFA